MNYTPATGAQQQAALADLIGDLDADQLRDMLVHIWSLHGQLDRAAIKGWRRRTGLSQTPPKTHMDL